MTAEHFHFQSSPDSRDINNCGLNAIVYPSPASLDALIAIQKRLGHRTGPIGAGVAVTRWDTHQLESDIVPLGLSVDPDATHYVISAWQQNNDAPIQVFADHLQDEGYMPLAIVDIPTHPEALGRFGLDSMPQRLSRIIVQDKTSVAPHQQDEQLARSLNRLQTHQFGGKEIVVPSWSRVKTTGLPGMEIFKAVGNIEEVRGFYPELHSQESQIQIAHGRYPTLTPGGWLGSHPFQSGIIRGVHNGNIISYDVHRDELQRRGNPLHGGTDSEAIPTMIAELVREGMPLELAMLTLSQPESEYDGHLTEEQQQALNELRASQPAMLLDGPAGIIFTDGEDVYACTGRKGLRPIYVLKTDDGAVHFSSEPSAVIGGSLAYPGSGKVRSGEYAKVSLHQNDATGQGVVLTRGRKIDALSQVREAKNGAVGRFVFTRWDHSSHEVKTVEEKGFPREIPAELVELGMTGDHVMQLGKEGRTGKVEIASMGANRRLAIWTGTKKFLDYHFIGACQVADPPVNSEVDPIDMFVQLGGRDKRGDQPNTSVMLKGPFLLSTRTLPQDLTGLEAILDAAAQDAGTAVLDGKGTSTRSIESKLSTALIATTVPEDIAESGDEQKISAVMTALCENVEKEIDDGKELIVLSDIGQSPEGSSVFSATLTAHFVDNYLRSKGKRSKASLVVESPEIASAGDTLKAIALGADSVLIDPRVMLIGMGIGKYDDIDPSLAASSTEHLKIKAANVLESWREQMEKLMGGADLTDIRNAVNNPYLIYSVGINGLQQRMGLNGDGMGFRTMGDFIRRSRKPFADEPMEKVPALIKHRNSKTAAEVMTHAKDHVRLEEEETSPAALPQSEYFDCLSWREGGETISPDDVSLETELTKGVQSGFPVELGGSSLGSIGRGLHTVLSEVLPKNGIFYNTGEGGRPIRRAQDALPEGANPADYGGFLNFMSPDKWTSFQVASGRFGVSLEVLMHSGEIQIKMGQGAKPGQGGHLPGAKVTEPIAMVRGIPEGSAAISPATHNDVTSIEDFRLLVSWLRESTGGEVPISVKLAAVPGIDAIALGCARGGVDKIVIDGFRGGTGAAPKAQQAEVGIPVAEAIAQVDDALRKAGVRDKVKLVGGGGLRSVDEMLMLIAMGADGALVTSHFYEAMKCNQCMQCQAGECHVHLAVKVDSARDEDLNIDAAKENLQLYLDQLKIDMKARMAALGVRSTKELTGRRDLLKIHPTQDVVKALAPSIPFDPSEDYTPLLSPILERRFVTEEAERIQDRIRPLKTEGDTSDTHSEIYTYRIVEAMDHLVDLSLVPGITPVQREALRTTFIGLQELHSEESVKELGAEGERILSGDMVDIGVFKQHAIGINSLTQKLGHDRLWGSTEARELQYPAQRGRALGELLRTELESMKPTDDTLHIDWSQHPLQGDRCIGIAAARAYVRHLEENYQTLKPPFQVDMKVSGVSGDYFGSLLPEGMTLRLTRGDGPLVHTQNNTAECMNGGKLIAEGHAGDSLAYAMRRGSVQIEGHAGSLAGCNLRGKTGFGQESAVVVVGGGVAGRAFEQMSGGTGIVIGAEIENESDRIGRKFASGMFGGQIFVRASEKTVLEAVDVTNRPFVRIEPLETLSPDVREHLSGVVNQWGATFGKDVSGYSQGWVRVTSKRAGGGVYSE